MVEVQRKSEKVAAKAALKERREAKRALEKTSGERSRIDKPGPGIKKQVRPAPKSQVPERVPELITRRTGLGFGVGCNVIHNGSRDSPHFGKVGKIVQIIKTGTTEQLVISFGSSSGAALSPKFVTIAGG